MKRAGLNSELSNEEIEQVLRQQSNSRDNAVNYKINERKALDKLIKEKTAELEKNKKDLKRTVIPSRKQDLSWKVKHGENQLDIYKEDRRRDVTEIPYLSNDGNLNNRNSGALKHEVSNSTGHYSQDDIDSFIRKREEQARK